MRKEPLSVAVCVLVSNGKILLLKRAKDPYLEYWSLPAGKIEHGEHVSHASVREALEETGLETNFINHLGVVSEHLIENGKVIGHFLMHICELEPKSENLQQSEEGELKWFDMDQLADIDKTVIPSDFLMIEKFIKAREKGYYDCLVEKRDNEHILRHFK
jgi:8-oxo-dGTP diphosphatase